MEVDFWDVGLPVHAQNLKLESLRNVTGDTTLQLATGGSITFEVAQARQRKKTIMQRLFPTGGEEASVRDRHRKCCVQR